MSRNIERTKVLRDALGGVVLVVRPFSDKGQVGMLGW